MNNDETQIAPFNDPAEQAYAWSVDDTVPYLDAAQRTTLWLRVCAGVAAVSVAALIGVLVFVLLDRDGAASKDQTAAQRSEPLAAQTPALPAAAAPTETVTKTVAPQPIPTEVAPASDQTTFVICGDGREGVVAATRPVCSPRTSAAPSSEAVTALTLWPSPQ